MPKIATPTAEAAPAETPTPQWQESTENRCLRCTVKPSEMNDLAKEQSELIQEVDSLEEAKKASASQYKAHIDEKSARARRIAGHITNGWIEKDVKCEWKFECSGFDSATGEPIYHPEKKALIRLDTGEVVEVRDITNDERQLALPIEQEQPQEAEAEA